MSLSLWKTEMPVVKRFITLVFILLKYEKNIENSPPVKLIGSFGEARNDFI